MKLQNMLNTFKETFKLCDLYDLGFSSYNFTWWDGRQ